MADVSRRALLRSFLAAPVAVRFKPGRSLAEVPFRSWAELERLWDDHYRPSWSKRSFASWGIQENHRSMIPGDTLDVTITAINSSTSYSPVGITEHPQYRPVKVRFRMMA